MIRYTPQEYALYIEQNRVDLASGVMQADPGPESNLQGKIVKYCKDHGYPCLSFRQSRKAEGFLVPGWPDLTICLQGGHVIFLELKSKHGQLKKNQKELAQMMLFLGHHWYKITSYRQFLGIVEKYG